MRLAISMGDPKGVGPEISVHAARKILDEQPEATVCLFGIAEFFAPFLGSFSSSRLAIVETASSSLAAEVAKAPRIHHAAAGEAQFQALKLATHAVQNHDCDALVTGPTSKEAIVLAGHAFIGQTEFLARSCGLEDDDVTMLFLGPRLNTGLVTTHLPLSQVSSQLTVARVKRTIRHLSEALRCLDIQQTLPLLICGTNPHAGENGLFGSEEKDIIEVAVRESSLDHLFPLIGPIGAETAFRNAADGRAAGVVSIFHDQATIASKLLDWGHAVNVTWGLPFLRTSVDHGVGYEAAESGEVDPSGMLAATRMAIRLLQHK